MRVTQSRLFSLVLIFQISTCFAATNLIAERVQAALEGYPPPPPPPPPPEYKPPPPPQYNPPPPPPADYKPPEYKAPGYYDKPDSFDKYKGKEVNPTNPKYYEPEKPYQPIELPPIPKQDYYLPGYKPPEIEQPVVQGLPHVPRKDLEVPTVPYYHKYPEYTTYYTTTTTTTTYTTTTYTTTTTTYTTTTTTTYTTTYTTTTYTTPSPYTTTYTTTTPEKPARPEYHIEIKPDYKEKGYGYEEKKYPDAKPPEYYPQRAPVPEGPAGYTTPPAYPTPPPYKPPETSPYPPPPPPSPVGY